MKIEQRLIDLLKNISSVVNEENNEDWSITHNKIVVVINNNGFTISPIFDDLCSEHYFNACKINYGKFACFCYNYLLDLSEQQTKDIEFVMEITN